MSVSWERSESEGVEILVVSELLVVNCKGSGDGMLKFSSELSGY